MGSRTSDGETSLPVGSSRFWIDWVTRHVTNVPALRVGADRSWRSQEHCCQPGAHTQAADSQSTDIRTATDLLSFRTNIVHLSEQYPSCGSLASRWRATFSMLACRNPSSAATFASATASSRGQLFTQPSASTEGSACSARRSGPDGCASRRASCAAVHPSGQLNMNTMASTVISILSARLSS
jgi:hypothetical protein